MSTRCGKCGTLLLSAAVPLEVLTGRWHALNCPKDPQPYADRARAYEQATRTRRNLKFKD